MTRALVRSVGAACACALASCVLASCGGQQVPLVLRFPSTETFLVSRAVRIRVYEIDEARETTCATLVTAISNGRDPDVEAIYDSDALSPCAVRAGATVPDVGAGLHGFLVQGLDSTGNETILAGCVEGEIYGGASLEVDLYPTSSYADAYLADPPGSESIMSRCGGGS